MSYIGSSRNILVQNPSRESRFTKEYTSTGGETSFNITFNGDNVEVTINGIRLQKYDDFTPLNNNRIVLAEPTSNGDIIQCEGYYTFNSTVGTVLTIQDVNDAISNATYYVTQSQLYDERQNINTYINDNTNIITTNLQSDLSLYNKRTEKGRHIAFSNLNVIDYDVTVEYGENAMLIGPIEIGDNSTFTVNGTLTVV